MKYALLILLLCGCGEKPAKEWAASPLTTKNTNSLYIKVALLVEAEATNCTISGFDMGAVWATELRLGHFTSAEEAKRIAYLRITNWLATRPGRWP